MGQIVIDSESSTKEQIAHILSQYEHANKHDLILTALIYQRFYGVSPESSFSQVIHKIMTKQIPNPETIQRERQKLMKKCDMMSEKMKKEMMKKDVKKTPMKKASSMITAAFSKTKGSSSGKSQGGANTARTNARNGTKK